MWSTVGPALALDVSTHTIIYSNRFAGPGKLKYTYEATIEVGGGITLIKYSHITGEHHVFFKEVRNLSLTLHAHADTADPWRHRQPRGAVSLSATTLAGRVMWRLDVDWTTDLPLQGRDVKAAILEHYLDINIVMVTRNSTVHLARLGEDDEIGDEEILVSELSDEPPAKYCRRRMPGAYVRRAQCVHVGGTSTARPFTSRTHVYSTWRYIHRLPPHIAYDMRAQCVHVGGTSTARPLASRTHVCSTWRYKHRIPPHIAHARVHAPPVPSSH